MSEPGQIRQFSAVDRAPDPNFAIRFMEVARGQPGLLACKREVLDQLHLRPGAAVLEAGCGFGADVTEMAARVLPGGRAVGIDRSEAMITFGRERYAAPGVTLEVGDVTTLPFADASFDACRHDTVLQHIPDHRAALAELFRVLRPGGRMAGFELDLETHFVDSPHRAITRLIVESATDSIAQGWAGRQLPGMYRSLGLTDVTVAPRAMTNSFPLFQLVFQGQVAGLCASGALDPADAERWWADLREAEAAGRFLAGITALVVAGTKPA